jgi:hypothetical protein
MERNDWFWWQLEKEKKYPLGEDWEELIKRNEEEKLDEKKMFLPAFVKEEEK